MSDLLKHDIDLIKETLIKSLTYIDYIKRQNMQLHIEANDASFIENENSRCFLIEESIHQSLEIPVFES